MKVPESMSLCLTIVLHLDRLARCVSFVLTAQHYYIISNQEFHIAQIGLLSQPLVKQRPLGYLLAIFSKIPGFPLCFARVLACLSVCLCVACLLGFVQYFTLTLPDGISSYYTCWTDDAHSSNDDANLTPSE